MEKITPRWEWRTFGSSFGVADERIDALESTGVQESEETYIIAPGAEIVKLRAALLDIKTLRATDPNGLEQWFPVLKAEFPLSADDVAAAASALRQPTPDAPDGAATLEDLLTILGAPDSGVKAVAVKKRRVRYTIGGCTAERSDVEADGHQIRTIAIEDPDPDKVITAVRDIGLGAYVNRSYVAGLPGVIADAPERFAVIDCGTNSIKLHLAERTERRQVAPRARPGRGDQAGRGPGAQRQHRRRCGRANRRRHRGHGGRDEGGGGAGHRRGRHGGLADRQELGGGRCRT